MGELFVLLGEGKSECQARAKYLCLLELSELEAGPKCAHPTFIEGSMCIGWKGAIRRRILQAPIELAR